MQDGEAGRPSTSMERTPYQEMGKRSRFCSTCKKARHKRTTCPDRGATKERREMESMWYNKASEEHM
jgi:predicted secreted protein